MTLDHQVFPGVDLPATERTEVFITHDAEYLYVAMRALDREPAAIRGRVVRRDALEGEDYVRLYLDTFNDRRRAYVLTFNPLGIQADGLYNEGTTTGRNFDGNIDATWDGVFTSAGTIDEGGYVVEAAIPFRTLRFSGHQGRIWGLHVQRWIARKGERTSWRPVSREASSLLTLMGTLTGLDAIRTTRPLDLIPTFVGAVAEMPDASGRLAGDRTAEAGLTGTWLVTPNTSIGGTVNPDFSQVEADVPQVDVNQRFPLFYAEKRPFFLEGGQFFRSPGALTFVNTRQIVAPDWGLKVTGKAGANTFAALVTADAAPGSGRVPGDPDNGRQARFAIGRYQRDLGANSTVGAFITSRDFGRTSNRVLAVDGQVRLNLQTVGYQVGISRSVNTEGRTTDGHASYVWYDFVGRHWRLFVNDTRLSAGYQTNSGFLRRNGYRSNQVTAGYEFQAPEGAWWVDARPFIVARHATNVAGRLDEAYFDPGLSVTFARNVSLYTYVSTRRDFFADRSLAATSYTATVKVAASRAWNIDTTMKIGQGANFDPSRPVVGRLFDISFTGTVTPTDRLSQAFIYLRSRLTDRDRGGELFDQQILRSRTSLQFTRDHAFRTIAEFNDLSRRLSLSLLYSYTPRPNTAIYVGYDDLYSDATSHADAPHDRSTRSFDRLRRTFFVKLGFGWRLGE